MATDMELNKKAPPDLPNGEEQDTFQAKYSMFLPVGEVRRGLLFIYCFSFLFHNRPEP